MTLSKASLEIIWACNTEMHIKAYKVGKNKEKQKHNLLSFWHRSQSFLHVREWRDKLILPHRVLPLKGLLRNSEDKASKERKNAATHQSKYSNYNENVGTDGNKESFPFTKNRSSAVWKGLPSTPEKDFNLTDIACKPFMALVTKLLYTELSILLITYQWNLTRAHAPPFYTNMQSKLTYFEMPCRK